MAGFSRSLAPLMQAAGRHRASIGVASGALAGAAAVVAAIVGLSGAAAEAQAPAPSNGRVLKVMLETRTAPDPTVGVTYAPLQTLSAQTATAPTLDPDLEIVQQSSDVQQFLDREAAAQKAMLADIARTDAQVRRTLADAPTWPTSVAESASAVTPAPTSTTPAG